MFHLKIRTVVLPIISASLVGCAPAPDRLARDAYTPPVKPSTNLVVRQPVDATFVDVGDGKDLVAKIQKGGGEKGAYESTQQFGDRLKANLPSRVAFTRPMDLAWYKYDADSQMASVRIDLPDASSMGYRETSGGLGYYPALLLGGGVKFTGQYVGQNAFGASAVVDQVSASKIYAVLGASGSSYMPKVSSVEGGFYIPREEMAKSYRDLALRIEGSFVSPFYSQSADYQKATITSKQETSSTLYFFRVAPARLSVLNVKTGKVYAQGLGASTIQY